MAKETFILIIKKDAILFTNVKQIFLFDMYKSE